MIFANRSYAILNIELGRVGATAAGEVPGRTPLFALDDPTLDWVQLAGGMGVEAVSVDTIEAFDAAFASAMRGRGPRLIEVVLD